ncbi:MAG TPA: enoyl-CoA hydratase-related protein [Acidimicrobiales bacterium]|nr:enoyl-CoA hydratase-related protein [Acidimicrobiales bacterium]
MSAAAGSDLVLSGVEDGVAGILFNRADTRNAWTPEMADAYHDALDAAADDDDVKVIVVTGAGDSFCTAELRPPPPPSARRRSPLHPLSVPKPIIAAVNGACEGMGLAEALLCDVRFASASATMTLPYVRRGRPLPDALAWLLPRVVGLGAALDVALSGRDVNSRDALRLGLVSGVFADDELTERVVAYAGRIVERADASAAASIKAQVYRATEMGLGQTIDDAEVLASQRQE